MMLVHQSVNIIVDFLQRFWLLRVSNASEPLIGYFLWLNERIEAIKAANATANIHASNTVTGSACFGETKSKILFCL